MTGQNSKFSFTIIKEDKKSLARVGQLSTPHGIVNTPCFTPVGTQATVKALTSRDLKEIGVELLFGNTYHLHLRPGEDVVKKMGGLSKFMSWNGPTFTDSGGFQVFSLGDRRDNNPRNGAEVGSKNFLAHNAKKDSQNPFQEPASDRGENFESSPRPRLVKITDDGVKFRSHLDGSLRMFTPEESIRIQHALGADLIIAFDECLSYFLTEKEVKKTLPRIHEWEKRSLEYHKKHKSNQLLYGVIQGAAFKRLRKISTEFITGLDFGGVAIGGVANAGESKKDIYDVVSWVSPLLPKDKPRHLLGVGEPDDIFEIIERGMDTFDCVIPTRLGRTGFIFVSPSEGNLKNRFKLDITKAKWQTSKLPLDKNCGCYVCKNYTRGYVNHLFRAKELLAYHLASYHNTYFLINLTKKIREAILDDRFQSLKKDWLV